MPKFMITILLKINRTIQMRVNKYIDAFLNFRYNNMECKIII